MSATQSSFGNLFRRSAFASLETLPHINSAPQILTAPVADRITGNYGLKHNIPPPIVPDLPKYVEISGVQTNKLEHSLSYQNIQVESHDHPWTKYAVVKPATEKVKLMQVWSEITPVTTGVPRAREQAMDSFARDEDSGRMKFAPKVQATKKPEGSSGMAEAEKVQNRRPPPDMSLMDLSPKQWRKLLQLAREIRPQYLKEAAGEKWEYYLSVYKPTMGRNHPAAIEVHPPHFHNTTPENTLVQDEDKPHFVKGRYLNPIARGGVFAVGVGGHVAILRNEKRPAYDGIVGEGGDGAYSSQQERSNLVEFVVDKAAFDDKARPQIQLTFVENVSRMSPVSGQSGLPRRSIDRLIGQLPVDASRRPFGVPPTESSSTTDRSNAPPRRQGGDVDTILGLMSQMSSKKPKSE
ncbi:uncharacterized protein EV422DRAFT_515603 [Fimicolochytrium jonesii]|uniref:uncharacterized protein n=1 Tax=Fimicolochytrium jonesii TaxID=1396493 RepID=UPI0022FDB113|nr:uncharacterized protein EV422DRAFT_515603 [Fimicolochytrium jonesii]KAI8826167.1 hypothetical protein EV422DRAFT_515603 [Fimicolochytrium jonesii]